LVKNVDCSVKIGRGILLRVYCPVKNRGIVLIYTLNKTPPIFTRHKLRPPGKEIESSGRLPKIYGIL